MAQELEIRSLTRPEVDEPVGWAASEGWVPACTTLSCSGRPIRQAFIAIRNGTANWSAAARSPPTAAAFGFMGLFIVRPEFRSAGWAMRCGTPAASVCWTGLQPGASIGMDGVFDMQHYYAKGGFVFSHRNMRFPR